MTTTHRTLTIGRIRQVSPDYGYATPAYRPARFEMGEGWGDGRGHIARRHGRD